MNKVISRLLKIAYESFSNHGCNDLPDDFWDGIDEKTKAQILNLLNESYYDGDFQAANLDNERDDVLMLVLSEWLEESQ